MTSERLPQGMRTLTSGFLFSFASPLLLLFLVVLEDVCFRKPGTFLFEAPAEYAARERRCRASGAGRRALRGAHRVVAAPTLAAFLDETGCREGALRRCDAACGATARHPWRGPWRWR